MKLGCVLLAAGEGSRLGGIPKGLIKLNGKTLIKYHIEALNKVGVSDLVVVTGHYADRIESVLKDASVKIVRNHQPQADQASSVRLGLETLGSDFDLVIMMLSDQPLMNQDDLQEIISVYQADTSRPIILPIVNGQRGNPAAFRGDIIEDILNTANMVCRKYMDIHPDKVFEYQTNNDHFIIDIDRIEDIELLKAEFSVNLELPI